jgi:hypothetical protein
LRNTISTDLWKSKCRRFYAATMGRPGLAPGIYFRVLLVGYFEPAMPTLSIASV